MMRKSWSSVLLFCLITTCCAAQTAGYKFYAPLDSIKTSGFYNIEITPELSAHLKIDYSDLRIVNDSGKWVPHVLYALSDSTPHYIYYMPLNFTKKDYGKVKTELLIKNEYVSIKNLHPVISNIIITIGNTSAVRFCTLSGSDDYLNWFVINDSISINPLFEANNTRTDFTINFPPINYKHLKLEIYNNSKDPFDIKYVNTKNPKVLVPALESAFPFKQSPIPVPHLVQKDSIKTSYIKIIQQQPYHFDHINLKLSGVKYFSRKVDLYIPTETNHSFSNPGQLLRSFTISNNSTLQFNVPISNAPVFYLLINNEDNLPLKATEVTLSVYSHLIRSYLEKGNHYKLIMENADASLPHYDLSNINSNKSDSIPFISFGKITAFEQTAVTVEKIKNNKWILWSAIITVLLILLLFTKKMVKEVDKRKEHDSL
jgi:hypothetical protein